MNPWTLLGYALVLLTGLIAAAWGLPVALRPIARRVESLRLPRLTLLTLALFLGCATLLSAGHVETSSSDPTIYYAAALRLHNGENPYVAPAGDDAPAYTWIFLAPLETLAAAMGIAGIHVGVALAAVPLPLLAHRIAQRASGDRAAAFAGALTLVSPFTVYGAARWAMDEVFVALAILVCLHGLLGLRSIRGVAAASLLAVKFTAFVPVGAWILQESRRPPRMLRFSLLGLAVAIPFLLVLLVGLAEFGPSYWQQVYAKTTTQRLASPRASANLFVLLELMERAAPTALVIVGALAFLVVVVLAIRLPAERRLDTGLAVTAAFLIVLPSMNTDFVAWILPLLALRSATTFDARWTWTYLLLVGSALFHDLARYRFDGVPHLAGLVVTATVLTAVLGFVVVHALSAADLRRLDEAEVRH